MHYSNTNRDLASIETPRSHPISPITPATSGSTLTNKLSALLLTIPDGNFSSGSI
jgi:hypothetical protein